MLSSQHFGTFKRPFNQNQRDPDFYPKGSVIPGSNPRSPSLTFLSNGTPVNPVFPKANGIVSQNKSNINDISVKKGAPQTNVLSLDSTPRTASKASFAQTAKQTLQPTRSQNRFQTVPQAMASRLEQESAYRGQQTEKPLNRNRSQANDLSIRDSMRSSAHISARKQQQSFLGSVDPASQSQGSNALTSSQQIAPPAQYGGIEKDHYDLNPMYTSLSYRQKGVQPIPPPRERIRATFAIYTIGYGYDSAARSYGRPNGMGFMVTQWLAITTHSVLPNEKAAEASYAQFRDGDNYRFDPYICFITSSKFDFTIVAFNKKAVKTVLRYQKFIETTSQFSIKSSDQVNVMPFDAYGRRNVLLVDKTTFTYTSGIQEPILPGTPVFDSRWFLQGIHINSTNHICIALRIEPVMSYLDSHLEVSYNPLIEKLLHSDRLGYLEKFHGRFLYYFEWFGKTVWRFNIDRSEWSSVIIRNAEKIEQTQPTWCFHWNSRLCYLPDGGILIIGGHTKETGNETNEVWMYSPQRYHTLARVTSMIYPRENTAVVFVNNYVYCLGGMPHLNSCERYSVVNKTWQRISSLFHGRYDAAACTALDSKFVFVFCGEPLSAAGKTIERYNIDFDHWELLSVTLPRALSRLSVFPITNHRIAIMGGKGSHWWFILNMNSTLIQGEVTQKSYEGHQSFYQVLDAERPMDNITEVAHPVAFCRDNNKLYFINLAKHSHTSKTPDVATYNIEYFDLAVDYATKPYEMAPTRETLEDREFAETMREIDKRRLA